MALKFTMKSELTETGGTVQTPNGSSESMSAMDQGATIALVAPAEQTVTLTLPRPATFIAIKSGGAIQVELDLAELSLVVPPGAVSAYLAITTSPVSVIRVVNAGAESVSVQVQHAGVVA